jgi:hypothetical protein
MLVSLNIKLWKSLNILGHPGGRQPLVLLSVWWEVEAERIVANCKPMVTPPKLPLIRPHHPFSHPLSQPRVHHPPSHPPSHPRPHHPLSHPPSHPASHPRSYHPLCHPLCRPLGQPRPHQSLPLPGQRALHLIIPVFRIQIMILMSTWESLKSMKMAWINLIPPFIRGNWEPCWRPFLRDLVPCLG